MIYKAIIQTPIGKLGICTIEQLLSRLDFLGEDTPLVAPKEIILVDIVNQLNQYFKCSDFQFNIPYLLQGTLFQKSVWQTLSKLPKKKLLVMAHSPRS